MIRIHAGDRFALLQRAADALINAAQHVVAFLHAEHADHHLIIIQVAGNHVAALCAVNLHQEIGEVASAGQHVGIRHAAQTFVIPAVSRQRDENRRDAQQHNHAEQFVDSGENGVHFAIQRIGRHDHNQIPSIVFAVIFNLAAAETQLTRAKHTFFPRLTAGKNLPKLLRVLFACR